MNALPLVVLAPIGLLFVGGVASLCLSIGRPMTDMDRKLSAIDRQLTSDGWISSLDATVEELLVSDEIQRTSPPDSDYPMAAGQ